MSFKNSLQSLLCQLNDRYVRTMLDYEVLVPIIEYSRTVPRILFQICLRGKDEDAQHVYPCLDKDLLNNIKELRNNNPDYTYQLICDYEARKFILKHYGERVYNYYLRINKKYGAARADFLRYLVLYATGGVYLDLKSTVLKALSQGIREDDSFLIMYWDSIPGGKRNSPTTSNLPKGELLTGFLVSSKGHPFMRKVIIQTLRNIDSYNPFREKTGTGVLRVTGNEMFSIAINSCVQGSQPNEMLGIRYEEAFHNFGFKLHFSEGELAQDYSSGDFQKKAGLTDYRKQMSPIVASPNICIRCVNNLYYFGAKCYLVIKKIMRRVNL